MICLIRLFSAITVFAMCISGCVQMPTEKSGVSDLRPQISFSVEADSLLSARVSVDGLYVGMVEDFVAGKAALRVLSGVHRINVFSDGRIFLDEKVYVGDGVSRTLLIK